MGTPSGLGGQLGLKTESSVGTAVVVDTFHAGLVSETVKQQIARIESQGIRAGRRTTHTWKPGAKTVGGGVTLELWNEPLATLLTHMFGSVATTGTGPYTHTATPGDLTGKAFTAQFGRPDTTGTVRAFTYAGCKLSAWTISCAVGEIARLVLEVTGWSETTETALASASYPADGEPFVFVEGSLSIAGTAVATVRNMTLQANQGLATTRHRMGSATVKEQLENGTRSYTGQVETDFESLTAYQRFVSGAEAALVMEFDNGTDSLTITCNVRFDGDTPELTGAEILRQRLPIKCVSGTSDAAAITAVLVNGEASAA